MTFDTTVTLGDDNRLTGQASTTVQYADFGLSIPNVPAVVSVEDSVQLQLDFVAAPVAEGDAAA